MKGTILPVLGILFFLFACGDGRDPVLRMVMDLDISKKGDRKKAELLNGDALDYYRHHNFAAAEKRWADAAAADPSWWWPYLKLAGAAARQGKTDHAREYYRIFLCAAPAELIHYEYYKKGIPDMESLAADGSLNRLYEEFYRKRFKGHWVFGLIDAYYCLSSSDVPAPSYNQSDRYEYRVRLRGNGDLEVSGFFEPDLLGYRAVNTGGYWYVYGNKVQLVFGQKCNPDDFKDDEAALSDCNNCLLKTVRKTYYSKKEFLGEYISKCAP